MDHYPSSMINLITNLSKLPGIGKKTGERLALHILRSPYREAEQLAQSILELKQKIRLCHECFALSDHTQCAICQNPIRDRSIVCVVENPADMAAIEKSGAYSGLYHILQGVISPLDGVGPDDIRLKELFIRIQKGTIKEIILATNTNVEGEATAGYIAAKLRALPQIKVSRIASGIPMGGELKYIDPVTLKRAIDTRYGMK
ncbi:MAG: recombination protein RecR [Desulfobacterales bacterium]|nr:recombination protein RecR [Desulfobacterales bacterium]